MKKLKPHDSRCFNSNAIMAFATPSRYHPSIQQQTHEHQFIIFTCCIYSDSYPFRPGFVAPDHGHQQYMYIINSNVSCLIPRHLGYHGICNTIMDPTIDTQTPTYHLHVASIVNSYPFCPWLAAPDDGHQQYINSNVLGVF